jgi:hypothetical protein
VSNPGFQKPPAVEAGVAPGPVLYGLPQVAVARLQIPFGDIFVFAFKFAIAMIPVGIIMGILYAIFAGIFSLAILGR